MIHLRKLGALGLGIAPALTALGAFAASDTTGAEKTTGLPQFDPSTFTEQVFWLIVLFAIFYVLMSRLALPRLTSVLDARRSRIDEDLEQAQKLKADAEKTLQDFEKLMADARTQAYDIQAEARQSIAAHAAERQTEVEAILTREADEAEKRIQASINAAITEIKILATEPAVAIVDRVAGIKVSAEDAVAAVDSALSDRR